MNKTLFSISHVNYKLLVMAPNTTFSSLLLGLIYANRIQTQSIHKSNYCTKYLDMW